MLQATKPICLRRRGLRRSRWIVSLIERPPSINETSFNCPHCGALAKQFWFRAKANSYRDDQHPTWLAPEDRASISKDIEDRAQRQRMLAVFDRVMSKRPFIHSDNESTYAKSIYNLNISKCYNCNEIALWVGERMIWPERSSVVRPNPDMPIGALADYEEASQIVDLSPRGAAALLRLAIQKLCVALGEKGKNLNDDISSLVEKGLDKRVQQALDVVRVIGNNAVHPGELDIKDDRSVADNLFGLVNLIVDRMISQPKHVEALFSSLPPAALDAIAKRDTTNQRK